jgi:acyl-CoA hydrolase
MPRLFDENILPLDAVLIQVSPPDKHGYCSLGVSVEATRSAVRNTKKIIAQINQHVPRVHGDTFVHMNKIDAYAEYDEPLIELDYSQEITDVERTIGKRVAELIDDKSTRKQKVLDLLVLKSYKIKNNLKYLLKYHFFLHIPARKSMAYSHSVLLSLVKMGIGTISDYVLERLENHKDLSIASEMISDGVMTLIQKGVVTNRFHPGRTTCTFILGTKKLYDFVDDNPNILVLDVGVTNDPAQIRQNRKMCAINSALEIDLTGVGLCRFIGFDTLFRCWRANGFYAWCCTKSTWKTNSRFTITNIKRSVTYC